MAKKQNNDEKKEIPVIGDVDDWEKDVVEALLEVPVGGECTFYIDSAGGTVYGALAVLTLMRQRRLTATAIVLAECSSAALLLFAGCQRRYVTRHCILFFHRMRWQSDKRVNSQEAFLWARHFEEMERDIEDLEIGLFGTAEELVRGWVQQGQYVTGSQMVAAGLAELLEF